HRPPDRRLRRPARGAPVLRARPARRRARRGRPVRRRGPGRGAAAPGARLAGPVPARTAADELDKARAGDVRALARLLALVEDESPQVRSVIKDLLPATGRARIIGLTGAPGVGKSTMTSALVGAFRAAGRRVAVLAVDPTSPFTGGALLGDRVRMQEHAADEHVYIRSMASRGHLGGLAASTPQATRSEGIQELVSRLSQHWAWLSETGELKNRRLARAREELTALAFAALRGRLAGGRLDELAGQVADGTLDPFQAADELLSP